jgi:transposase
LKTGKNRYIPIENLPFFLPPPLNSFSPIALGRAICALGGHSKFRPRRIKLTQALKDERVAWCQQQLQLRPNPEDWEDVLFSDETWAVNDYMWKQRGILFDDEDEEEIEDWALERRRPKGWMFWGSFAGGRKGPSFFWEKEYGGINSEKYIFYILPLVQTFQQRHRNVIFQQDNASSHRSRATTAALGRMGINILRFPRYSPDLTPIENVWPWMKHWIESRYDIQSFTESTLRPVIQEAWNAVPEYWLRHLSHTMPDRLRKCIASGGKKIPY